MIDQKFLQGCTNGQINMGVAWLKVVNKNFSMLHTPDSAFDNLYCNSVLSIVRAYCTNPNDAWPIILENDINIKHSPTRTGMHCASHCQINSMTKNKSRVLRAAMEVYLLMGNKS